MDIEQSNDIKFINKFLYNVQKHRIALGAWIEAKKRDKFKPSKRAMKLYEDMEAQEKEAKRMAKEIVLETDLWYDFFESISGLGEALSTSLMAEIGDIEKFRTVSALWAYAGLISQYITAKCEKNHKLIMSSDMRTVDKPGKQHTQKRKCPVFDNDSGEQCGAKITVIERVEGKAPKRSKGFHYLFNGRLKMICWKISEQMVKQGDPFYRDIYDKEKKRQAKIHKDLTKLHIHNRAKRKMVKVFLFHLWEAWRESERLTTRPPYVIEKLGHNHFVSWKKLKPMLLRDKGKISTRKKTKKKGANGKLAITAKKPTRKKIVVKKVTTKKIAKKVVKKVVKKKKPVAKRKIKR